MSPERIRRSEGLFWLVIGVLICVLAWRTGLSYQNEPGPGFIAFLAGAFMFGVGITMTIIAAIAGPRNVRDRGPVLKSDSVKLARIVYTLGLLFCYGVLLEPLGYIPTTFLILWGLFYDWERKNWCLSLVTSLLITAFSYILIEKLLGLPLPSGIL